MKSKTTAVAEQCRMHDWVGLINECQSRPKGTKIDEWCLANGVTRDAYYSGSENSEPPALSPVSESRMKL